MLLTTWFDCCVIFSCSFALMIRVRVRVRTREDTSSVFLTYLQPLSGCMTSTRDSVWQKIGYVRLIIFDLTLTFNFNFCDIMIRRLLGMVDCCVTGDNLKCQYWWSFENWRNFWNIVAFHSFVVSYIGDSVIDSVRWIECERIKNWRQTMKSSKVSRPVCSLKCFCCMEKTKGRVEIIVYMVLLIFIVRYTRNRNFCCTLILKGIRSNG